MSLIRSIKNAGNGLLFAIRTQRNMKIHMAAILVVIATGFYLSFSYVDWSLSILAIGLVIGLEVLNTSIEELVNFVSPEKREIAGRIKDLAAGAVLAASIAAFVVGLLIVISKL